MTRPYRPATLASDLATWTHHELRDEIERLRNNADLVLHEATRLLEIFVAEHFPPNPDWKPQPDLLGVVLQLDNASTIARDYKSEIERLRVENWQLKGALGYPVPGHIIDNSDFKCGLCEAKTISLIEAEAEIERLRGLLTRCETVLGNMALENEGAIFNRWPISHEPLRSDARNLLPLIKQATEEHTDDDR